MWGRKDTQLHAGRQPPSHGPTSQVQVLQKASGPESSNSPGTAATQEGAQEGAPETLVPEKSGGPCSQPAVSASPLRQEAKVPRLPSASPVLGLTRDNCHPVLANYSSHHGALPRSLAPLSALPAAGHSLQANEWHDDRAITLMGKRSGVPRWPVCHTRRGHA